MTEKSPRSPHHLRLSSEAMSAAQRLAELAGVPVPELLEIVLLELVASGDRVKARGQGKRPRAKAFADRGPARVIPIMRPRVAGPGAAAPSRRTRLAFRAGARASGGGLPGESRCPDTVSRTPGGGGRSPGEGTSGAR